MTCKNVTVLEAKKFQFWPPLVQQKLAEVFGDELLFISSRRAVLRGHHSYDSVAEIVRRIESNIVFTFTQTNLSNRRLLASVSRKLVFAQ